MQHRSTHEAARDEANHPEVPTIHQLDERTIGQIAAGEIIERPASVVKELVENSVDAGATRVAVSVENGGLDLIEVVDDAGGISPDDLPLAVRRHATSKLGGAAELEAISTLGFRGEGLASIAAVSSLEIVSRPPDREIGARLVAEGETVSAVEPMPAPTGTRICVRRLFDTLPVRREYLRGPSAEFNRISGWLSHFALAYPGIAFTLRHEGKEVWVMPGTASERERLAMVFGGSPAKALIELDGEPARTLGGALRGYVSAPGHDRSDRRMQLLFVNRRLVRGALVAGAWTGGYSTFTMLNRHPYGVLFLDMPPGHVDANVHPTKHEVRFRYGSQVFDALRRSISATLKAHARARFAQQTGSAVSVNVSPDGQASALAGEGISLFARGDSESSAATRLRVLEQLDRTFIVVSDGDALLLVDQHAAHERIAYEAIVAAANNGSTSEPLLVPQILELDGPRSAVLDRTSALLREGGLEIEPFGERTYRIVATPAGYASRRFDMLGLLDDLSEDPRQRDVRERIWASLACHSVTVAGETLAPQEMTTLVDRLQRCANPMHCPHGRPTMIRLSSDEIARMFKRV